MSYDNSCFRNFSRNQQDEISTLSKWKSMTKKEYKSHRNMYIRLDIMKRFQAIAMEAFKSYMSIRNKFSRVTKSSPLTADKFARLKLSADDYVWMSRYQIQQCGHFVE